VCSVLNRDHEFAKAQMIVQIIPVRATIDFKIKNNFSSGLLAKCSMLSERTKLNVTF